MISLNHICYGLLTLKVIRGHRMSLYVNKVKVEKYTLKPYFWHEYSYAIFDQHKLWHFDHKTGIHINIFNLPGFMWGPLIFKRVKQNNKKITMTVNILPQNWLEGACIYILVAWKGHKGDQKSQQTYKIHLKAT